jgi:hypothetical protein
LLFFFVLRSRCVSTHREEEEEMEKRLTAANVTCTSE